MGSTIESIMAIPAQHPYVEAVAPQSWDPVPMGQPFWPHPCLEPSWWHANERPVNVVHVHFGFEHLSLQQTEAFTDVLKLFAVPLVLTVHDLDNPHLEDQTNYHKQLEILLGAAAHVFTLTSMAQEHLLREYGVYAEVTPHPHIVPTDWAPTSPPPREHKVGVFLKSLRTNAVRDVEFYKALGPVTVYAHQDQAQSETIAALAELDNVDLVLHEPFDDDALFTEVASCDTVVLPYLRGTHSGWLEMCRDLGVSVIVPDCGCYVDQADTPHAVRVYRTGDGSSCAEAVAASQGRVPFHGDRLEQLAHVRAQHEAVYSKLAAAKLSIALIAPARFPIMQPYAGGLESFCDQARRAFTVYGHRVDLYAAQGSEGHVKEYEFPGVDWTGHEGERTDHTYPPGERDKEDESFVRLVKHLATSDYDVIFNNSLHPELFKTTEALPSHTTLRTTLHTPPLQDVEDAINASDHPGKFAAVSASTGSSWTLPTPPVVIPNTFDERLWRPARGEGAIWFGRIVPEKGLHLAIDAARAAGLELTVAGRVGNPDYYATEVEPRLGPDITMVGECSQDELTKIVRNAGVCLVTPQWEEPFGLVVIEAMASGTPVAALARGGVVENLSDYPQLLAEDPGELPQAIRNALALDPFEVARWARKKFGRKNFVDSYINFFRR